MWALHPWTINLRPSQGCGEPGPLLECQFLLCRCWFKAVGHEALRKWGSVSGPHTCWASNSAMLSFLSTLSSFSMLSFAIRKVKKVHFHFCCLVYYIKILPTLKIAKILFSSEKSFLLVGHIWWSLLAVIAVQEWNLGLLRMKLRSPKPKQILVLLLNLWYISLVFLCKDGSCFYFTAFYLVLNIWLFYCSTFT